jgi:hypothetical protein
MTTANNPPAAGKSKTEGHDDSTRTTAQETILANDTNAADTYNRRMAHQTAALALNAVFTSTPAADVARLATDADERDFPTAQHWHIFTAAAEQARTLTAAGNGALTVPPEAVSAALQARGQLTDTARTVILDAVAGCRAGRALAPTAAAAALQALKRWRWQQAARAVAEQAHTAAETGSDADAVRLLQYAAHLTTLARRAGVVIHDA